jgi:hypothetical protein
MMGVWYVVLSDSSNYLLFMACDVMCYFGGDMELVSRLVHVFFSGMN